MPLCVCVFYTSHHLSFYFPLLKCELLDVFGLSAASHSSPALSDVHNVSELLNVKELFTYIFSSHLLVYFTVLS